MIPRLRIGFVALVLTLMTLVLAPLQIAAIVFGWPLARHVPFLWHRVACRVAGFRVAVRGTPASARPLLLASNHVSWADIVVMGSIMPLSFIAKSEVRGWPVFGWLAMLQRTVFVERAARGRTGKQAGAIAERLNEGDAMVLFAEGTTSDGNEVLPFKTALFGAAQSALQSTETHEVLVQPVAIAYTRANGVPLGRVGRPLVAWNGDVELLPHLAQMLREGAIDVEVVFGDPLRFREDSDRKATARAAEAAARRMLAASLTGRPQTLGRH